MCPRGQRAGFLRPPARQPGVLLRAVAEGRSVAGMGRRQFRSPAELPDVCVICIQGLLGRCHEHLSTTLV